MRTRALAVVALSLLVASAPAASAAPYGGPVTFEPADGSVLQVQGRGSYRGDLEVRRSGAGLSVVNVVDLESYVMGIAEVPPSWPLEALKAQAVAARTYALWEMTNGAYRSRGYDICGTVACQVYSGVSAERRRGGERWVRAVRETAGQVLLHGGEPILARYHASSGGRTLPNEIVYPSSGAHPYLEGVADEPDSVSPLSSWTVRFTYEEMREILRKAFDLAGVLETIEADPDRRRLVIRTQGGQLEMNIVRFRREVSDAAHRLYPSRFPSERSDGRLLPITLPSSRFTVTKEADGFRVDGRGYGHGVGMSQWGAKGRADRGDDHVAILGAYYGGLKPQRWTGATKLRVGLRSGAEETRVSGDGAFRVREGRNELAASTLGTWRVSPGPGSTLQLEPPTGHDLPLVLSGVAAPGLVEVPRGADRAEVEVRFVVPKAAQVSARLMRGDEVVASTRGTFEAGPALVRLAAPTDRLPARAEHTVQLVAFDGSENVTASTRLTIEKPGSRAPLAVVLATVMLAAAVVAARRKHGATGPPSAPVRAPQRVR
ncbi:MAG TPA: SpoIID/LytB domain-containing protein [Actinomycetota bacterium]|nr:SpoIID/LytB domain-containing protein [Actinomycetota bacterium]